MLDKSIPYKNVIMKAELFDLSSPVIIPEGFSLKCFENGDEYHWADIETSVGEFNNVREACDYFVNKYLDEITLLSERCVFILDRHGRYAGTCTAWHDQKGNDLVGSLHWLAVKPDYQGNGLGKCLVYQTMKTFSSHNQFPVYLHTQTWSHKAILLYSGFGFSILKSESFSQYQNDFDEAMEVLSLVLDRDKICDLRRLSK